MTEILSFYTLFQMGCLLLLLFIIKRVFDTEILRLLKDSIQQEEQNFKNLNNEYTLSQQQLYRAIKAGKETETTVQMLLDKIGLWGQVEIKRGQRLEEEKKQSQRM